MARNTRRSSPSHW